jgi:hypothetical protein
MRFRTLKFGAAILLLIAGFIFVSSTLAFADQISEKEQWLKDNAAFVDQRTYDPPTILEHGGPDGGGYYFIDADDDATNAPVYNWVDISSSGTEITSWNGSVDDGYVTGIPIGMPFTFYGIEYNSVTVSTNGWISFLSQTSSYLSNVAIPNSAAPNGIIAVEWDDLDGGTVGHCYYYYDANNQEFIVSWVGWPYYPDATTPAHDLQVILKANGDIIAQYGANAGDWQTDVTVGIENESGTIGTQVANGVAYLRSEFAIYYGQTPPIYAEHDVSALSIVSPSGFGRINTPITPIIRFMNVGTNQESFQGHLIINHNGEVYNQAMQINNLDPTVAINVTFPDFTPAQEGEYELVAYSALAGDGNPANDTIRSIMNVYALIYNEDFEGGDGFFTGDNDWQYGEPTNSEGPGGAHSGSNLWAVGLAANYSIGPLLSTLISPPMGLGNNAVLSFWQWYSTESTFDGGNIKVSTDAGGSWVIVTPASGYTGTLSTNFGNPIGGEEAFYGLSNGWQYASFDLSAYAGSSVLIKFDFGSDSSVDDPGWFIDDFTIIGGGSVGAGFVVGTVTDLSSTLPIEGAIVASTGRRDTTDISGHFSLELFPGSYSLTASAPYHNDLTIDNVVVTEGDTTTQNFALTAPGIQVNTTAIDTSIVQGATATFIRSISNTGNGPLDFNVSVSLGGRVLSSGVNVEITPVTLSDSKTSDAAPIRHPGNPPTILDFGDELFTFDPQTPTGDEACLGMEFDGTYFWVSGRHPVDETHKLHKFDRNGNYIESFDQGTSSTWGWRDLTFDGAYLYGSDENALAQIDPATGEQIGTLPMPSSIAAPMRGLAYDPETDHFWAANFTSNLIEFNRSGTTLHSFPNTLSIYGLAWDNVTEGGPWLWAFSQDGTPATLVSQIDPATGEPTGVTFYAIDHDGAGDDLAGGACFTTEWNPSFGVLFCLVQGTSGGASADLVQGYEITPYSNWLIVSPTSGTINAGQSANLSITVDFTGANIVPDTTYEAVITITSNAQGAPQIPVSAHVGPVGIDDQTDGLPKAFSLSQNYPNPFNPTTEIEFALPKTSDVKLEVFNLLGQRVATLVDGSVEAGYHSVTWNASQQASGVYYYKIRAGNFTKVQSMTLVK